MRFPGDSLACQLTSDARLPASAIEHCATLCTCDRDFTRFPGLRVLNPLAKNAG